VSCQHVEELLPWFLNGSLTPEEEVEVRRHLAGCASCRRALAATLETARDLARHPPTEELVAFGLGEPVADRAALARHLEHCPACAEQLRLVRRSSLRRGEEDDSGTFHGRPVSVWKRDRPRSWRTLAIAASIVALAATGAWLHARWQLTETTAAHTAVEPDPRSEQLDRARAAVEQARDRAERLAARLAKLTARVDELEARAGEAAAPELEEPRIGVVIVQAFSELAFSRGSETPVEELQEVPASADEVVLMLEPSDPRRSPPAGGYRIELSGTGGEPRWSSGGLEPGPEGFYNVSVPGFRLVPGVLTVEVTDPTAESPRPVDRYRFRVVP